MPAELGARIGLGLGESEPTCVNFLEIEYIVSLTSVELVSTLISV